MRPVGFSFVNEGVDAFFAVTELEIIHHCAASLATILMVEIKIL